MTAAYTETDGDPDDGEGKALDAFADGMPYAFVVVTSLDPLNLRVATNHDTGTVRAILRQALDALPE